MYGGLHSVAGLFCNNGVSVYLKETYSAFICENDTLKGCLNMLDSMNEHPNTERGIV